MSDPPHTDDPQVSANPPKHSDSHAPQPPTEAMTTPTVVELPRRLESISRDTFLAAGESAPPAPGVVVPLHSRTAPGAVRRPRARRGGSPQPPLGGSGPGGDAA
jgi:hypothetical protein